MKVLIVSHTVLSHSSNMGKTLLSYFSHFPDAEIAQFYIHSEVPTDRTVCRNYYRFTDKEALKSVFRLRRYGRRFADDEIEVNRVSARTDTGILQKAYQFGSKRTGTIYLARNLVWKFSNWFTPEFKQWLEEVSPDVVFFASGDYAFMYDIARRISAYLRKPLVIACVDDFYVYNMNQNSAIGRFEHKFFLRTVQKTIRCASAVFCICDFMARKYAQIFSCPVYVLHTAAQQKELHCSRECREISYIGNLGCDRYKQLIEIGRCLKKMSLAGFDGVDVYSAEKSPGILSQLTEENGIRFHGQISAEEVLHVMENSAAVIHTEAFDPAIMERVRYSVSTKIAESLMYGPCLFAYGPVGIASMDYLKENRAAYVVTEPEKLEEGLEEFLGSPELRQQILRNARALARKNHSTQTNSRMVRRVLEEIIEK